MRKALSVLLVLCLCLSLGCAAFASSEEPVGLVLINGKEGKSEPYGMNTYYEKLLSAADLEALDEASIVVYEDAGMWMWARPRSMATTPIPQHPASPICWHPWTRSSF